LVLRGFVEDEVGIRRSCQATDGWITGPTTDIGVCQEQVDDVLNSPLNALSALRRGCSNMLEDGGQIGKCPTGVTEPHGTCFAQPARTSSSVANSPRAASSLDAAIAARSSSVRAIGGASSAPAS